MFTAKEISQAVSVVQWAASNEPDTLEAALDKVLPVEKGARIGQPITKNGQNRSSLVGLIVKAYQGESGDGETDLEALGADIAKEYVDGPDLSPEEQAGQDIVSAYNG